MDLAGRSFALSLVDILVVNFSFAKKRSLAAAARVCKTWKEPALDALWKKLSSPFPLLELLGPLVYEDRGWDGLENPNWDVWLYYAKRVRSVDIADMARRKGRNSLINPEVAIYLLTSFNESGGKRLIPNIQVLGLQCYFPSTPSLALLFVAPSLKSLDFFVLDSPSKVLRSVRKVLMSLNAMRDLFTLKDFTIHYDETQERRTEFERVLVDFLRSQPTVSSFAFGVLRDGTPLAGILAAIPRLRVLALSGPYSASEEELRAEIAVVADNARDIEYFNYFGVREDSSLGSVLFSTPPALLRCANLKELVLGCIDPTGINSSLIEDMGRAWPRMESLELLPDVASEHVRGIPPDALIRFAAAFPSTLRNLAIPLSFSNTISLPLPETSPRFAALRTLGVGFSVISKEDFQPFIELLNALSTHYVSVESSHDVDVEQAAYWKQVNELLLSAKLMTDGGHLEQSYTYDSGKEKEAYRLI
ncbi:hypothetical protein FRC05_011490 [Tulasnella sp. 425]|nr:hypothetical protein FRC05_011490 [Tulasnella sp. 425]